MLLQCDAMPKEPLETYQRIRCSFEQIKRWAKAADNDDRADSLSQWIRYQLDKACKPPRKR